jgi:DNA-binding GntR family transcriptional regulator
MMSDRSIRSKPAPGSHVKILKAVSLREQIYEHLRERIRTGQLTFEDRLVDVDIATQFGVSRMPVREALMQLVHDGAIESTSRGFMLRRYSDQEIADIFEIRRLLEPAAAEIAARKMTESALAIMESAIQAGIAASVADDFAGFVVANATFREAWIAQIPNRQLIAALSRYFDHVQIIRLVTLSQRPVRDDVLGRLRLIHNAFRAGDAKRAAALFRDHVDEAETAYRTYSNRTP